MTQAKYLTLLGFLLLIYARQLRDGDRWDKAMGLGLTLVALFVFVYSMVTF